MAEPRVLVFDIENSPLVGYSWSLWQTDIIRLEKDWHLLSFAWKWLGESKIHVLGLDDFPDYERDRTNDYYLAAELHALIDSADAVLGHNSDAFDMRKAYARFIAHGFDPPSPVQKIDTLKIAKKHFMFTSNKLDSVAQVLGVTRKADAGGFDTWLGCLAGDPIAWKRMKKYNKQDVRVTEEVYYRLLPYAQGHPNLAFISGDLDACPKCGSHNLTKQGYKFNRTTKMQQYKCGDCGGWCSSRIAERSQQPSLVN
jgi:hypothetical protein